MTKRKRRSPSPPLWYKVDPKNKRILILRNGSRIKQSIPGVGLYTSRGGLIYALTKKGLSKRTISYNKKKNYGKKTKNGVWNGQRYPYVLFRRKKYDVHLLVVLAWIGPREEGYEIDHITGNIDDCRLVNLRLVTKEENRRCAQILRRLRKAAKQLKDPSLDPIHIPQERLLKIFASITVGDPKDIMEYEERS